MGLIFALAVACSGDDRDGACYDTQGRVVSYIIDDRGQKFEVDLLKEYRAGWFDCNFSPAPGGGGGELVYDDDRPSRCTVPMGIKATETETSDYTVTTEHGETVKLVGTRNWRTTGLDPEVVRWR